MICNFKEMSKECMKGLLLLMNGLCIISAMIVFGEAIADTRILSLYGEDETIGTLAGDVILIVVCTLLISVAIVGCVGVIKENVKMLSLYVGFILILVILELMVGIFLGVERWGLRIRLSIALKEDFYRNCTNEVRFYDWDWIQSKYECCGLNGPEDYPSLGKDISIACCARAYRAPTHAQPQMYKACIERESYYHIGCEEEILYYVSLASDWLVGFAFICFWFETGGVVMAMWVAKTIKNSVVIYTKTVKY